MGDDLRSSSVQPERVSFAVAREQLKSALEGNAPWEVRLGFGTSVFFDFGEREPAEDPTWPDRGADQLWIYSASWRLFDAPEGEAGSADDESVMAEAVQHCIGRVVERIHFDEHLNLSLLFVKPGPVFCTLRQSTSDDAWTLFRRRSSYSFAGDGNFYHELDSQRRS